MPSTVFLYFIQKFLRNTATEFTPQKYRFEILGEKWKDGLEGNAVKQLQANIELKCQVYIGLLFWSIGIVQNFLPLQKTTVKFVKVTVFIND